MYPYPYRYNTNLSNRQSMIKPYKHNKKIQAHNTYFFFIFYVLVSSMRNENSQKIKLIYTTEHNSLFPQQYNIIDDQWLNKSKYAKCTSRMDTCIFQIHHFFTKYLEQSKSDSQKKNYSVYCYNISTYTEYISFMFSIEISETRRQKKD